VVPDNANRGDPAIANAEKEIQSRLPRPRREVRDRLDEIERVEIVTQESAVRIISKTGPLHNPADRDHCLQYIAAVGLIFGELTAEYYEDRVAADPRIDRLRERMTVVEEPRYSREYLEAGKRSIANAVQVFFKGGAATQQVEVEYPLGHRRRRAEGMPLLLKKARANLAMQLRAEQVEDVVSLCLDRPRLEATPVIDFVDRLVVSTLPGG
jgi:2-methylcitrate dehydratase